MKSAAVVLHSSPYVAGAGVVGLRIFGSEASWTTLGTTYVQPEFWLTVSLIAACGAIGAVVYELVRYRGIVELPHRVGYAEAREANPDAPANAMVDLGIVGRALSGAVVAVAVQWAVPHGNAEATLALATTAGLTTSPLVKLLRRQIAALANAALKKSNESMEPSRQPFTHTRHSEASNVTHLPHRGNSDPATAAD